MRGQKLVLFLMLSIFIVGSALILRGPAYGWKYECCFCMACSHTLCHYCMGESTTCGYCNESEIDNVETSTSLDNETLAIRPVQKSVRATKLGSLQEESFLLRMAGDPARRNLLLTLTKHPDYKLTRWCPGSEQTHISNSQLASQSATDHDE